MGDEERATQPRHVSHTSVVGYPMYVDPELTPPPQEVPAPASLDGYSEIPHEIRQQLDTLSTGLGNVTSALTKLWDNRHDSERLRSVDARLTTLTSNDADHRAQIEEFLKPAVKTIIGQLQYLVTAHEANKARFEVFWAHEWPAAQKALGSLDDRLGRIEKAQDRQENEMKSLATSVSNEFTAVRSRVTHLESAVQILELRNRDQDVGDKRELAITKKQRAARAALVPVLGAVGGAIAQLASWLIH